MTGKYSITVDNNVLQYKFEIKRNITIIKGDSATGKTTLVDMIREHYENGDQSGVFLQCDKQCAVLEGRQWQTLLKGINDSIIFIDEGNPFITSTDFAEAVSKSDNYFVIVTRESLSNLPFSVDEIYGIKSSGKYGSLTKTYQEFYNIYTKPEYDNFVPDVVIVEDSNSGYDFYAYINIGKDMKVESAGGKSGIFKMLGEIKDSKILIIADGAAFGSEMDRIMKRIAIKGNTVLYLPESFEWLLLKSEIVKDSEIKEILMHPYDYIDSKDFMSWERFFSSLLIEKTKGTYLHYNKSELNEAYKTEKISSKIVDTMPKGIFGH